MTEDELEIKKFEEHKRAEEKRQKAEALLLEQTRPLHLSLFEGLEESVCNDISRRQRNKLNVGHVSSLSYAECSYDTLFQLIGTLHRIGLEDSSEGTFVDLGSGIGKVVFGALLCHNFSSCVGIEILSDLHSVAVSLQEIWEAEYLDKITRKQRDTIIKFIRGDCCHVDWSYGDVVLVNSTCFDDKMFAAITKLAWELKSGAYIVSLSKKLPERESTDYFHLIDSSRMQMSWGACSVYFYRRNQTPRPSYIEDIHQYVGHIIQTGALPLREYDPDTH